VWIAWLAGGRVLRRTQRRIGSIQRELQHIAVRRS